MRLKFTHIQPKLLECLSKYHSCEKLLRPLLASYRKLSTSLTVWRGRYNHMSQTGHYLICGQMIFWLVLFLRFIRHSIYISWWKLLPWYCIWVSIHNRSWGTVSLLSRWWAFVWGPFPITDKQKWFMVTSRSPSQDRPKGKEEVGKTWLQLVTREHYALLRWTQFN